MMNLFLTYELKVALLIAVFYVGHHGVGSSDHFSN